MNHQWSERLDSTKQILAATAKGVGRDKIGLLAAGLSFYALLSLAPLLLVMVYSAGVVLGQQDARAAAQGALRQIFDADTVSLLVSMMRDVGRREQGPGAAIFGGMFSLFVGARLFVWVRKALDEVWDVKSPPLRQLKKRAWPIVRKRLISGSMVFFMALVFMASMIAQTAFATVSSMAVDWLPASAPLWRLLHVAGFALIAGGTFAVLYKVLPDTDIEWSWVRWPAFVAALIYVGISVAVSRYLGYDALSSLSGAAGAIIAVMFWVFFSAISFLVGAEACRAMADRDGYRAGTSSGESSDASSDIHATLRQLDAQSGSG